MGMAAALSGALGRTMSPLAGAQPLFVLVLPISTAMEIAKRTAPGMIIGVIAVALFML